MEQGRSRGSRGRAWLINFSYQENSFKEEIEVRQENEIVKACGELGRYDDDQFTPPLYPPIANLRGEEYEEFWSWIAELLEASARNAIGMLREQQEGGNGGGKVIPIRTHNPTAWYAAFIGVGKSFPVIGEFAGEWIVERFEHPIMNAKHVYYGIPKEDCEFDKLAAIHEMNKQWGKGWQLDYDDGME